VPFAADATRGQRTRMKCGKGSAIQIRRPPSSSGANLRTFSSGNEVLKALGWMAVTGHPYEISVMLLWGLLVVLEFFLRCLVAYLRRLFLRGVGAYVCPRRCRFSSGRRLLYGSARCVWWVLLSVQVRSVGPKPIIKLGLASERIACRFCVCRFFL